MPTAIPPPTTANTEQLTDIESQASPFFKITNLGTFFYNLFQVLLIVAALSTFFYLLWGGIEYITSGGNQEKTKTAKDKITQALIGLAITASVWLIWRLVLYFLGVTVSPGGSFNIDIPTPELTP